MSYTRRLASTQPAAQAAGPTLTIDPTQGRHDISPGVYGLNGWGLTTARLQSLRTPVTRWGGNATSEYNWMNDKWSSAGDWYFEIFGQSNGMTPAFDPVTHNHSAFDRFHETNVAAATKTYGTVPILGWIAADVPDGTCSYSVKKYGPQQKTDPWRPDCGNGTTVSGGALTGNDPRDTDIQETPEMMTQWVQHMVQRYGSAAQGGIAVWSLDNEPVWWDGTHRSVHPQAASYDDVTNRGLAYAAAVKAGDPTAAVAGPVTGGWWDLFFSHVDLNAGWATGPYWGNAVDRKGHGDLDFVAYYLKAFADYERQHGQRILDYIDVHGYIPGTAGDSTDATSNQRRLQSPRLFWDTTLIPYGDPLFYPAAGDYRLAAQWKECLCLIPRLKNWIDNYYPGTKIAITEYNLGNLNGSGNPLAASDLPTYLNGALAQADLLGVFGREGVDVATIWGNVGVGDPVTYAYQIYRNYDGLGSGFGETSVSASSSDYTKVTVYGAQRSDSTLTLMVINKTASDLSSTVTFNNFSPAAAAQQWTYSAANLTAIVRGADLPTTSNGIPAVFPANSMTMLIVMAETSAPKPLVSAVKNFASHGAAIAPGATVELTGTNLGPAAAAAASLPRSAGLAPSELSTVRVWFEGFPAPVYWASATRVIAAVPYATAGLTTLHVQVEYQGVRSDALATPLAATAPAIFTADGSGAGAALAIESATGALFPVFNSTRNPAKAGTPVSFFVTGAGVLDPPPADGRLGNVSTAAQPAGVLTVLIGGKPAIVSPATPAGGSISTGILMVTATVPGGAGTGPVPLLVTVGGASSANGVTLAVQ